MVTNTTTTNCYKKIIFRDEINKGNGIHEVHFKVNENIKFNILMEQYCIKRAFINNGITFLFNGKHIYPDSTPKDLKIKDYDNIEVKLVT